MLGRLRNLLVRSERPEEAACYRYGDSLFVCAISEIRNGPGVEWQPYQRLPAGARRNHRKPMDGLSIGQFVLL